MIPGKRYSPGVVLAIGWRRKWLILIPTVVMALTACGVIHLLPNRYRAETAILVMPQRVPERSVRSTATTKIEDPLRTIDQQVRSRTQLERIIEDLNLYLERRKKDLMQDIVDDMSDDIDVDIVHGSVVRIAFTSDDPRTAMQVTGRLGTIFIDESLTDRTMLRILDPARLPERPVSPNRPILYLFGVGLALAIGAGAAAGAEYLDDGLRSADDVRLALAMPVLATIPVIASQKPMSLWAKLLRGPSAAATLAAAVGAARVVLR